MQTPGSRIISVTRSNRLMQSLHKFNTLREHVLHWDGKLTAEYYCLWHMVLQRLMRHVSCFPCYFMFMNIMTKLAYCSNTQSDATFQNSTTHAVLLAQSCWYCWLKRIEITLIKKSCIALLTHRYSLKGRKFVQKKVTVTRHADMMSFYL